jgi:hypothetical protein
MTRYPSERLAEEVAFLSYYFHWPYEQIMALDHHERQHWVAQLSRLNSQRERSNQDAERRR